jgi:hypothetical protein
VDDRQKNFHNKLTKGTSATAFEGTGLERT